MTRDDRNIVIIGFMGSGKSTLGIKLSYKLKRSVVDTDKFIEERSGRTIAEIFRESGEERFRDLETEALEKIAATTAKSVISCGGGVVKRPENIELLKRCGKVVYLRARPETIYERVKNDTNRPLLQCEDPKSRIEELLHERSAAYEAAADIIVDVDGLMVYEVVDKVMDKISKRRKLLVLNGPNINFIGIRERHIYGTQDYNYLIGILKDRGKELRIEIEVFQSNHEGAIIDRIQRAYYERLDGIIINAGAYTHYSYAIRDALASVSMTKVEVHISDITQREDFRKISVIADVCDKQIIGKGLSGYLEAVDFCIENFR